MKAGYRVHWIFALLTLMFSVQSGFAQNPNNLTKKTIIVFAHQDDDLLWMLPFWKIADEMVLAAVPASETHRKLVKRIPGNYFSKWHPAFGDVSDQEFAMHFTDACSPERKAITVGEIRERLRPYISDPNVFQIITHNNWGEYGHLQHRLVNQAVRSLAVQYGKDVWAPSIRAYIDEDKTNRYDNTGSLGLRTLTTIFDQDFFFSIRKIYEQALFPLAVWGANRPSAWTWRDGINDHPTSRLQFIQLVDHGIDRSIHSPAIGEMVRKVPILFQCHSKKS